MDTGSLTLGSAPPPASAPNTFNLPAAYGSGGLSVPTDTINPNSPGLSTYTGGGSAPAPGGPTDTTGGGGSGLTATQVAAAALQSKIDAVISGGTTSAIDRGQGDTAAAAGNIGGLGDTLDTSTVQGQNAIDSARREIGTTQINTIKQLMNTIRQGIQGTGVQLGNTGALSSSARDAAARAYGNYGNVETNKANNDAATGNISQDVAQSSLNTATGNGLDYIAKQRDAAIGTIQANAQAALQQLAVSVAYLGGDASKVDIPGIQKQIIDNAQNQLAGVDQTIQQHIAAINPMTGEQTATAAEAASNAGIVASSQTPFSTTPTIPTTDPNAAPVPSLIPLTLGKPQTDPTTGV